MKPRTQHSRLMMSLAAGALLAALPVKVQLSASGPSLGPSYAEARNGGDDSGGGDSGGNSGRGGGDDHGGSDDSDDDHGGNSGGGGGDDHGGSDDSDDDHGGNSGGGGGDDHGGSDDRDDGHGGNSGRGGGDDDDDHGGNSGRGGGDDNGGDDNGGDRDGSAGKVEITPSGIEVVHADGTKEEIENGRYERKDASGRTVEERPATAADFTRLSSAEAPPSSRPTIRVGFVTKVEAEGGNLEVLYSTGWKEELENGRYELKDPNNNTVVERPARQSDIDRLQDIAGR